MKNLLAFLCCAFLLATSLLADSTPTQTNDEAKTSIQKLIPIGSPAMTVTRLLGNADFTDKVDANTRVVTFENVYFVDNLDNLAKMPFNQKATYLNNMEPLGKYTIRATLQAGKIVNLEAL